MKTNPTDITMSIRPCELNECDCFARAEITLPNKKKIGDIEMFTTDGRNICLNYGKLLEYYDEDILEEIGRMLIETFKKDYPAIYIGAFNKRKCRRKGEEN